MKKVYKLISGLLIAAMVLSVIVIGSTSTKAASGPYQGRLTGVNWFGFETSNYVVHGIWARDYKSVLKQIKDLGFNCVRIPWCNEMIGKKPDSIQINPVGIDAYTGETGLNLDLKGLDSLGVLDKIIQESARLGLMIILDNHSRAAGGYMNETLWYTAKYSEEKWISDWVMMAKRYKDYENVVAYDLNNEPHGNTKQGMKPPATWGYDEPGYGNTDWKKAAEKCGVELLKINPNALIIVEGVENFKGSNYWWGGNLMGVKEYPITQIPKANLVYSPHEYGPEVYPQDWFTAPDFPKNLPGIWDEKFWFIYKENIAPIFVGEFGIKDTTGTAGTWLKTFMEYAGGKCSWTYWSMNPNSGDTGGILKDDWTSVEKAKIDIIKPYLAPQHAPFKVPESPSTQPSEVPSASPSVIPSINPSVVPSIVPTDSNPLDVNNDGYINIADVITVAQYFNSVQGSVRYKSECDIDGNGAINISDIIMIAEKFNTKA